jgi:pyruvyltransferase
LTAEALEMAGIAPPSVFGDPGLLAADFVEIEDTKSYGTAVIPHYVDAEDGQEFATELGMEIIHVSMPIENFLKRVSMAEFILSSSLHGLICAESLGIPCVWIRFSDKLLGGDFKFHDYLSGTNRQWRGVKPIDMRSYRISMASDLLDFRWEAFDLEAVKRRLLAAFPLR